MKKKNLRLKQENCLHPSLEGVETPSKDVLKAPGRTARGSSSSMSDNQLAKRAFEHTLDSILSGSYELYENFEEQEPEDLVFYGDEFVDLPLFDEEDILILMHKDAHFSGSFSAMKEYYAHPEAKGVIEEIDPERIELLDSIQTRIKHDLAPLLITGPNAEKVALAKKTYADLQNVASAAPTTSEGVLAQAILSEEDIDKIIARRSHALCARPESLLILATSELFSDPLFPGYGTAPIMAIRLLGEVKYEKAVPELFSLVTRSNFDIESAALGALRRIGSPARMFALSRLASYPYTADHERAALVLIEFLPDREIERLFRSLLDDPRLVNKQLRDYLLPLCDF
jgi:hypothetical protein